MLIVWDYFGVLAQDAFWYTAVRIAEGMHMDEHMSEMHHQADLGRISWEQYCKEVSKDIGVPYAEVSQRYQKHQIKRAVVSTIHSLHGTHRQVLLSNASHSYLLPIMDHLGLSPMFEDIFVSSQIGYAKPDPRAYKHVLDAMNISAEDAIMIDDSASNIDAACGVGMNGILYQEGVDIQAEIHKLTSSIQSS
jgi:glucose-1-phosphatase